MSAETFGTCLFVLGIILWVGGMVVWGWWDVRALEKKCYHQRQLSKSDPHQEPAVSQQKAVTLEPVVKQDVPDPRIFLAESWRQAMVAGHDDLLDVKPVEWVGKSRCVSGFGRRWQDLPTTYLREMTSGLLDPAFVNPTRLTVLEILTQCAEEIAEEEEPIMFQVFETPAGMERVDEPVAVQHLFNRYLRTKGCRQGKIPPNSVA